MRRSRKKNHSVLHSEARHRNRKHKRRIRNLFLEIIFIIILVIVIVKFVKKDEEKPIVERFGEEQQKQIIEEELQKANTVQEEKDKNNIIELKVPENNSLGIEIEKVTMSYIDGQTILNITIKNNTVRIESAQIIIGFIDSNEEMIDSEYIDIPELENEQEIKINIVLEKDLSEARNIKIIEEQ